MKILGISALYHDSAAALTEDNTILAAAQEERFTRIKHDSAFPVHAIRYCLKQADVTLDGLDAIVFYDKPFLTFERLLETYYGFAPRGYKSFITAIPVWVKEKIFFKRLLFEALEEVMPFNKKHIKLLFTEHHQSHAASAYYPSPYNEAAILTLDGVGEWATAAFSYGSGNKIKMLKELRFPHSIGLLYSAFTYYLGFKVNSGEYKLMGLAPYGNNVAGNVQEYLKIIKDVLINIHADGSVWLNQKYFNYSIGLTMVNEKRWKKLFGFARRLPDSDIEQHHADMALAIQMVTEEIILNMAKELKKITSSDNLCIAGGVGLNCVANGKLLKENIFKNIFVQPAAGDAGGSLGAALAAYHIFFGKKRNDVNKDQMQGALLGPSYKSYEIEACLDKYHIPFEKYDNEDQLVEKAAGLIAGNKIVGWFQGRAEFGPRALGNRSILGNPINPETQKTLNLKVKFREDFRPFAPSVLEEDIEDYFDLNVPSPYMLMVADVKQERRKKVPDNYEAMPIKEKLYTERADIQAVTHVNFSARIQSVNKETNMRYWKLINAFKGKTGYGLIVNTSFNVRGEPIVCSPEDAVKCFMKTEIDCLVMDNYIIEKK